MAGSMAGSFTISGSSAAVAGCRMSCCQGLALGSTDRSRPMVCWCISCSAWPKGASKESGSCCEATGCLA
eukprot:11216924-Lingulodinium_polyedra.AAC.1